MATKKIKSDPIKTVLVITVGFIIVFALTDWKWALITAMVVGILGVFSEFMAKKIDFLWMKLTWVLSLIIPNILLTLVFYLFLTPIALASRIFGERDQLGLKNNKTSIFKEYNKKFKPESFEKTW